jgi:hypothetical protein
MLLVTAVYRLRIVEPVGEGIRRIVTEEVLHLAFDLDTDSDDHELTKLTMGSEYLFKLCAES